MYGTVLIECDGWIFIADVYSCGARIDGQKHRKPFQDGREGFDWYRRAIKNKE